MDPNTPLPQVGNVPAEVNPSAPITPVEVPTNPVPVEPITPPPATDQPPAPITPPPPTNQPVEPVKKSSPVFTIALTLLLVTILVLGGYMLWTKYLNPSNTKVTPTPIAVVTASPVSDPTVGWKTYNDEGSRFTFKYPANWKQSENAIVSDITPTLSSFRTSGSDYYMISTEYSDMNFSSWMQRSGTSNFTSGILNGYQTHSSYDIPGQTPGYEVLFEDGNKITGLNLFPYDKNSPDPKIIETFNQILSTFKFIEATPAASPASSPSATTRP